MKYHQVSLILSLTAALDQNVKVNFTIEDIKNGIKDNSIFNLIFEKIDSPRKLEIDLYTKDVREQYIGNWSGVMLYQDFAKNFGIGKNPLCVLIALAAMGLPSVD